MRTFIPSQLPTFWEQRRRYRADQRKYIQGSTAECGILTGVRIPLGHWETFRERSLNVLSALSKFIASIDESNKCRKKAEMLTGVASVLGTDVSHYRTRYSILALNA
jgi:hypothetical protein